MGPGKATSFALRTDPALLGEEWAQLKTIIPDSSPGRVAFLTVNDP